MSEPTETRPPLTVSYLVSESVNYPFRNWRFMLAKPVLWTFIYTLVFFLMFGVLFFLLGGWNLFEELVTLMEIPEDQAAEKAPEIFARLAPFYLFMIVGIPVYHLYCFSKIYALVFHEIGLTKEEPPFLQPSPPELRLWWAIVKQFLVSFLIAGLILLILVLVGAVAGGFLGAILGIGLFIGFFLLWIRWATYLPHAARGEGANLRRAFQDTAGLTDTLLGAVLLLFLITLGLGIAASFATLPLQFAIPSLSVIDADLSPEEALAGFRQRVFTAGFLIWVLVFGSVSLAIQTAVNVFAMAFGAKFMALVYDATAGAVPPEAPVAATGPVENGDGNA